MTTTALAVVPLGRPPDADVVVPGSKSITNRALLAAAMGRGQSRLSGVLVADDTLAMASCLAALGARVDVDDTAATAIVAGVDGRLRPGPVSLDARQSGTTARFLAAVCAAGTGPYTLDADDQMRRRPMGVLFDAIRTLGGEVDEQGQPGHLPAVLRGPAPGGSVALPGDVTSQYLSGLLLAGPLWDKGVTIDVTTPLVSRPYLEMTAAVMDAFGVHATGEAQRWSVGPGSYRAADYQVEPDASAASYFLAAAAVCGGRVRVAGLSPGSLQGDVHFADHLEAMGAEVHRGSDGIEVVGGGQLHGVDVDLSDVSDTAPTLAVVAAHADGPTRVRGIGFVRSKESDRIAAVVAELRRCGVGAEETDDGFVVHPAAVAPARIRTYDDHRMAMSFAVLGLAHAGIEIEDPGCVAKTFPGFWTALDQLRSRP